MVYLFINETHKVGALPPVLLWWSSLTLKTAYENRIWNQIPPCLERMRVLGSDYGMWETGDQTCFWLAVEQWSTCATACQLGLCGSPGRSLGGGISWSRERNLTLPDVGVGLLLHQPFNYSHNEFTVRLQHSSLTSREEQAQTLNELIYSFPTN